MSNWRVYSDGDDWCPRPDRVMVSFCNKANKDEHWKAGRALSNMMMAWDGHEDYEVHESKVEERLANCDARFYWSISKQKLLVYIRR